MQHKARLTPATSLLATWLAIALMAGLAACGSETAGPGTAHGSGTTQRAGSGSSPSARSSGSAGPSAPTATTAKVPAAAAQITCPLPGFARPADATEASQDVPGQHAQPIPRDFRPVAVVQCIEVGATAPGRGQYTNVRKQVAVAGLGSLMTALRQPSASPTRTGLGPACPVTTAIVPWLMLIGGDGQLIHPQIPVTVCGAPIAPVMASLSSLHWIELAVPPPPPLPLPVN